MTSSENTAQPEGEKVEAEPVTFYSIRTGASYQTSDPAEITRLRYSVGHTENKAEAEQHVQAEENPPNAQFDPNTHDVKAVVEYLSAHPEDYERVIAAEREGQNRKGIVGDK